MSLRMQERFPINEWEEIEDWQYGPGIYRVRINSNEYPTEASGPVEACRLAYEKHTPDEQHPDFEIESFSGGGTVSD